MYNTKDKSNKIHERIAVIAIYLPNVAEIPFENNGELLLEEYRDFLLRCEEIVRQNHNYKDMIVHNTCIYVIFDKAIQTERYSALCTEAESVVVTASQIKNIFCGADCQRKDHIGSCERECIPEQLYAGIGVAEGAAVRINVADPKHRTRSSVWLGKVFEDSRCLAQMAFCDGRDRIRIEDAVFSDVSP